MLTYVESSTNTKYFEIVHSQRTAMRNKYLQPVFEESLKKGRAVTSQLMHVHGRLACHFEYQDFAYFSVLRGWVNEVTRMKLLRKRLNSASEACVLETDTDLSLSKG